MMPSKTIKPTKPVKPTWQRRVKSILDYEVAVFGVREYMTPASLSSAELAVKLLTEEFVRSVDPVALEIWARHQALMDTWELVDNCYEASEAIKAQLGALRQLAQTAASEFTYRVNLVWPQFCDRAESADSADFIVEWTERPDNVAAQDRLNRA